MANLITTKWIGDDQVTGSKIRLDNGEWLRARNAADTADLNLIGANSLNEIIAHSDFIPRSGFDAPVENYIDNSSGVPSATSLYLTTDSAYTGVDAFGSLIVATPFTPIYSGDVQQVSIWLEDAGTNTGDLTVSIYDDNAGEPGILLVTSNLISRASVTASGMYDFTFTSPFAIVGGTTYWVSIEGDSAFTSAMSTVGIGRRDADYATYPVKWYDGAMWQDPIDSYSLRFQVYGEQQIPVFVDLGKLTAPWDNAFLNELRLTDDDNTNYVGFKAPPVVASDQIWILPDADGSAGQALVTDGAGNLSWDTVTTAPSGAAGSIQFSDGSAFASDNANLFWNDSTNKLGIRNNTPQGVLDVIHGGSGQGIYFLTGHTAGDTGLAIENGANIQGTNGNLSAPVNITLQPGGGNVIITTGSNHLPGSNAGSALGSSALRFNSFMSATNTSSLQVGHSGVTGSIAMVNTSGSTYGNLLVNAATPSAATAGLLVRAETALPLGLVTSATVSIASGDILIESGNATNGNTGSIQLRPGIVSGSGTRGSIVAHTTLRPNGGSINLGVNNTTDTWTNIYGQNLFAGGIGSGLGTLTIRNASALVGALHSLDTTTISGKTVGYRIRSQRTATLGPIGIDTDSTATFGIGTGAIYIETGDKTNGGAGTSGDIWFKTGTSAADSGHVVLETGTATGVRGKVKFQDGSQGTIGHVWTQTAVDGSGAWQAASGGANTALSNLIATAINQDLVWGSGIAGTLRTADSGATTQNLIVRAGDSGGSGTAGNLTLRSGSNSGSNNTGSVLIQTGDHSGVGSGVSGAMTIRTGTTNTNPSGALSISTGNSTNTSGNISISTGSATTRGQIRLIDGTEGTSGYVWTSTDTLGSGAWLPAPGAGGGEPEVEYRTITGGEAAADQLTLASTPATPTKVLVDILDGGGAIEYGVEFTVTGTTLDWSAGPLSGVVAAGDRFRITYWI